MAVWIRGVGRQSLIEFISRAKKNPRSIARSPPRNISLGPQECHQRARAAGTIAGRSSLAPLARDHHPRPRSPPSPAITTLARDHHPRPRSLPSALGHGKSTASCRRTPAAPGTQNSKASSSARRRTGTRARKSSCHPPPAWTRRRTPATRWRPPGRARR